jgi:cell division septum initiation protein DivIVA
MDENANLGAPTSGERPMQADDNDNTDDTFSTVIPVDVIATRHTSGADGAQSAGEPDSPAGPSQPDDVHESPENDDASASPASLFKPTDLPDLQEHVRNTSDPHEGETATAPDEFARATNASRDEFTTVYDLIDQLTESVDQAKTNFLTPGTVRLDREQLLEQLDDLKTMLPVQLERASSLMREAERRLDNAQAEADSIVANAKSQQAQIIADAQAQAQFLASHERVTDLARQKARKITEEAQSNALKLTQGANAYCAQVMKTLSEQLTAYGRDVKNGIDVIDERQKSAAQQLAQLEGQTSQDSGAAPAKKSKN